MKLIVIFGVWDMLHVGHVAILKKAKQLGATLVVGVPTDDVVCEDKGVLPVITCEQRCEMLEALECVDVAMPYRKLEFLSVLENFKPDVLVVGATWGKDSRHKDAEAFMQKTGGRTVQLEYTTGVSTTDIKSCVVEQYLRRAD